jgi:uncharacterized protein
MVHCRWRSCRRVNRPAPPIILSGYIDSNYLTRVKIPTMTTPMTNLLAAPCTAFAGHRRIARGPLGEVALAIKDGEVLARLGHVASGPAGADERVPDHAEGQARRPRGRPRLGVVPREVTLLPRHWEWLAQQPGGASQALRRLVEAARRNDTAQTRAKAAQERVYRFLAAIAGDLPGYEEVIRALFAADPEAFAARMSDWPKDISAQALHLARIDP